MPGHDGNIYPPAAFSAAFVAECHILTWHSIICPIIRPAIAPRRKGDAEYTIFVFLDFFGFFFIKIPLTLTVLANLITRRAD